MRVLFVVEVKDAEGTFQPRIGLGSMDRIKKWMNATFRSEMLAKTSEWRIVKYGPLDDQEEQIISPLLH